MKLIRIGGVEENIQENQRGMFLVITVSKIYENEYKNESIS